MPRRCGSFGHGAGDRGVNNGAVDPGRRGEGRRTGRHAQRRRPFTIFAPTNDAFAKLDKATLASVLADKATLTKILTYHVIAGQKLTAQQLADAGTEKTVEGAPVTIAKAGDTITINGQTAVVCGNVQTANGTVQIIDTVLMPS